jgi:predicted Zn-dependent protease
MRRKTILANTLLGFGALALISCEAPESRRADLAPETSAVRPASEQRQGDATHPKITAAYGGVYDNPAVTGYVDRIGRRIAAASEQPNARWTFTVLDTPAANAFAIPGGYVYVTRGLVALAGDEAELAGVIGHEIGHVTAGHSSLRQERGTVAGLGLLAGAIGLAIAGADPTLASGLLDVGRTAAGGMLASYSRGDELDADNLGIRYLARAGYDPYAQADFLDKLSASSELQARIAGGSYDPNRVDFFASHPATGPRTRQAIEVARASGAVQTAGADRNRDGYLATIDGMVYGDSAAQGFVDGRTFSHPVLRFTFSVPQGYTITNSAQAVAAKGPRNARFIMDGERDPGGALDAYITRVWAPQIARQTRVGSLNGPRRDRINGLDAATAVLPVLINGQTWDALLVAVRHDGRLYRMMGLAPGGSDLLDGLAGAARTFRALPAAEASRLREQRISVVTVRPGDTVEGLAGRMRVDSHAVERFRVLNGLRPGQQPRAGERVKLVQ